MSGKANAGRMNRICFDPNYGLTINGVINQTIYASSDHGGLWKSVDAGESWKVCGTDFFPQTMAADIAVSHQNSQNLFLASGMSDEYVPHAIGQSIEFDNLGYTYGVFRSRDAGANWESINGNLFFEFGDGGMIHRIVANPINENQIWLATTKGVYSTNNALDQPENVIWTQMLNGIAAEHDFRGLAFSHDNSSSIYCSGELGVFSSEDNGLTWYSISGSSNGTEFLNLPSNSELINCNITSYPSWTFANLVYAHVIFLDPTNGANLLKSRLLIYDGELWHTKMELTDKEISYEDAISMSGNNSAIDERRIAIAVHPNNPFVVALGRTTVYLSKSSPQVSSPSDAFSFYSGSVYSAELCHPDIHDLAFEPRSISGENIRLFCCNDGGVAAKNLDTEDTAGWSRKQAGLDIMTCWECAISERNDSIRLTGNQDNGVSFNNYQNHLGIWHQSQFGDGYNVKISDVEKRIYYLNNNDFFSTNMALYGDNITEGQISTDSVLSPVNAFPRYASDSTYYAGAAHGFPMIEISHKNEVYFGFSEVYKRLKIDPDIVDFHPISGSIWELSSDIYDSEQLVPNLNWAGYHLIQEMAIAPSNSDYVYLVTKGLILDELSLPTTPAGYIQTQIFVCKHWSDLASDGTDATFQIRTQNLPQYNSLTGDVTGLITGIAVSSYNPEHLWVSFTGFDPDLKVYESFDAGETWVNADPNGTLPNIPVNGIVFQNGSADRLFIASDAGTWIKDEGSDSWQKYGNMPNVRTTELDINYCSNKLFACTFGRGMWSTSLPPAHGAPYVVHITETDEIWSEDHYLVGSLQIDNGAKLTLNNGAKLLMPNHSFIAVDKGGTLVIDNATITNACGELWNGIQVYGDDTLAQAPASNQGYLIMRNNATIENAAIAVSLKKLDEFCNPIAGTGGGIIEASQAHFLNNVSDVEFVKYRFTNSLGNIASNRSHFYECEFITNKPLNAGFHNKWHVRMEDVTLVRFKGCTFINDRIDGINDQEGIGISSFNSTFELNEYCTNTSVNTGSICPDESMIHCRMENLNAGIIQKTLDDVTTFRASHTDFVGNTYGIHAMNTRQLEISDCTFDVSPSAFIAGEDPTYPYGVHLEVCNGYKVEKNYFNSDDNSMERAGIVINNSNAFSFLTMNQVEQPNRIYYNDFSNLYAATIAQGDNQVAGHPTEGLEMLCGYYENNRFDISITSWASQGRIAMKQGNDVIIPNNPSSLIYGAGNLFMSNDQNCPEPRALTVNPDCSDFIYFLKNGPNLSPDSTCYSFESVFLSAITSNWVDRVNECAEFQNSESSTNHRNVFFQKVAEIKDISNLLLTIEDGGDTRMLLDVINNTIYSSEQVRNSLLPICPNLSRTLQYALVDRNPSLSPWHLCQLLIACSPLEKDLFKYVVDNNILPNILLNILSQYQDSSTTNLQLLYSQLKQARIDKDLAKYEFIRNQIFRSPNGEVLLSELEALASLEESSLSDRVKISTALQKGDWNETLYLILESTNDSSTDVWGEVFEILATLLQEQKSIREVTSEQIAKLHSIAASTKKGSLEAEILLELIDPLFEIQERIVMPSNTRSRKTDSSESVEAKSESILSCFPNPSSTESYIAYDVSQLTSLSVHLQITNLSGEVVRNINVGNNAGLIPIDLSGFPSGQYMCSIFSDHIMIASTPLIKI